MATISLSAAAPKGESIRFVFGNADFSLKDDATYDTEDLLLLAGAVGNKWLTIEFPKVDVQVTFDLDPNDPHDNPAADHLSQLATPEVKAAAAEADVEIQAAAFPDDIRYAAAVKADAAEVAADAAPSQVDPPAAVTAAPTPAATAADTTSPSPTSTSTGASN